MKDQSFKQIYSFVVLAATIAWSVFIVKMVAGMNASPAPSNPVEATGAGALLGALITWTGLTVQFWFRKAKPTS